jgi:uroporphyrinogen-III synthase
MIDRRVDGLKVLVTREAEDAERWSSRLSSMGAIPVVMPCLNCENITDPSAATLLQASVETASWLVLSSRRGVVATARMLDGTLTSRTKIAVIGPSTARASKEMLGRADLVASDQTARGIADSLIARFKLVKSSDKIRVVMAGAAGGRTDVESSLRKNGAKVSRVDVYKTIPAPPVDPKRDLEAEGIDIILLASPSAVEGLRNIAIVPRGAKVLTIGPTTSAAAVEAGLVVHGEAQEPNLDSMLNELV